MITIDQIQKIVSDYFNMSIELLQLKTRKREIVQARQIAMYFSKLLTKDSLAFIGKCIGNKDHATVLHACRTVNNLIDTDKKFKFDVEEIGKILVRYTPIISKKEIHDSIVKGLIQLLKSKQNEK